jgi:hypothetical protein
MMCRAVLLLWALVSVALWFLLGHLLIWTFLHISWDVPLWLQHCIERALRKVENNPDYSPDAYDVEGALSLLLFVIAYLLATAVVASVSVIAWRRYRPR